MRVVTIAAIGVGWLLCSGVVEAQDGVAEKHTTASVSVFYTGLGQFEIIAANAAEAGKVVDIGRSVWATLAGPIVLPADGFRTPVTVRLIPADQWTGLESFIVVVETGGLVSVRIRWSSEEDNRHVRQALVRALLFRQGVYWYGVSEKLTVPYWLERGCTELSLVREKPAMLDAFQQEMTGVLPPSLQDLLSWERSEQSRRAWAHSSLWLLLQLQSESTSGGGWVECLRGLLGGGAPLLVMPRAYPALWADVNGMELWWQTAFQYQQHARALPGLSAAGARDWLSDRSRWLAVYDGREVVLALGDLWGLRRDPWFKSEMAHRAAQCQSILPNMHPYYTNAALSLGSVYEAAVRGEADRFKAALVNFEQDVADGREIEDTVSAILATAPSN